MKKLVFRFQGPLAALTAEQLSELIERGITDDDIVRTQVAATIDLVREQGDAALVALTRELDNVTLKKLRVPQKACDSALAKLDPALRAAMERMIVNLRRVHAESLPRAWEVETEPGITVGRRPDPLARVGIYAPGGRAAYPSSLLMAAIPASVAGVSELVVCSPPGPDGRPADVVLAAAALAEVDEVYAVGGAQAIAAMAYGTDEIRAVNRVVGPGNTWVAEAKLQVAGRVGIDAPAGPSELLVILDESAAVERVAAELLAQAEHDPRACAVALCLGDTAEAVIDACARLLAGSGREPIVGEALATRGAVLSVDSLAEAIVFANEYAAEHVLLAVRIPETTLEQLRNAGSVMLGAGASVVFSDYLTGANHVLPTGGAARSFSGLSTTDFIRWTSYQRVTSDAAVRLKADAVLLATAEGLEQHALAAMRAAEE